MAVAAVAHGFGAAFSSGITCSVLASVVAFLPLGLASSSAAFRAYLLGFGFGRSLLALGLSFLSRFEAAPPKTAKPSVLQLAFHDPNG
jgi:hypothetical protein